MIKKLGATNVIFITLLLLIFIYLILSLVSIKYKEYLSQQELSIGFEQARAKLIDVDWCEEIISPFGGYNRFVFNPNGTYEHKYITDLASNPVNLSWKLIEENNNLFIESEGVREPLIFYKDGSAKINKLTMYSCDKAIKDGDETTKTITFTIIYTILLVVVYICISTANSIRKARLRK